MHVDHEECKKYLMGSERLSSIILKLIATGLLGITSFLLMKFYNSMDVLPEKMSELSRSVLELSTRTEYYQKSFNSSLQNISQNTSQIQRNREDIVIIRERLKNMEKDRAKVND